MLVVTALYAAGLNGSWRFQRDSTLYMGLGRWLAEAGSYRFNHEPHAFVWPGFPAMLWAVYATVGESFLAMNALVSAFGLGCFLASANSAAVSSSRSCASIATNGSRCPRHPLRLVLPRQLF